jgi:hypothetical protein
LDGNGIRNKKRLEGTNSRGYARKIGHNLRRPSGRRILAIFASMKSTLVKLFNTGYRQITGNISREGRLNVTGRAIMQMKENGLDFDTVVDTFRKGRKIESSFKSYGTYSVSVSHRWDDVKKQYVITSCRKYDSKEK